MCKVGGTTGGGSTGGGGSTPAPSTPPPSTGGQLSGTWKDAPGVSFHIYETATYPNGQVIPGFWPGYNNVNNLFCTDFLNTKNSAYWQQYPWTAQIFGLPCGTCVRIMNTRNLLQTTVRVVDQGGKGFDLDYQRAFKPLDPDNQNWLRGNMDVKWQTVAC